MQKNAAAPPPPPPSRSARTRERILKVSLALFNRHGEANVTTGHIADELNISPGNLYYHFRNKDEIIQHLFADFERAIDVAPGDVVDAGNVMEDMWLYLHLMLERIWDYRFLYRNLDDLAARDPKLRSHFIIIIGHKRDAVLKLCRALVRTGAMKAADAEIASLAENILVVSTYWLNYASLNKSRGALREAEESGPGEELTRGAYQVMSLVAPYLVGEAREHLHYLMQKYTA